jgi:hypothetical protein
MDHKSKMSHKSGIMQTGRSGMAVFDEKTGQAIRALCRHPRAFLTLSFTAKGFVGPIGNSLPTFYWPVQPMIWQTGCR